MKRNYLQKKFIFALLSTLMLTSLVGCGDDGNKVDENPVTSEVVEQTEVEETEEAKQPEETTEVVEESTEEVEPSTEVVEDPTANLSNEEWVEYLNLQTPTYIIFNEINGNRQVLENGQKYTLQEGDVLAIKTPPMTYIGGIQSNKSLYITSDTRYQCLIYELNLDSITVDTEFSLNFMHNETEEKVRITVYLSK